MNLRIIVTALLALLFLAACSDAGTAPTPTAETIDPVVVDETGEVTEDVDGQAQVQITGEMNIMIEGEDVYVETVDVGATEGYILHINQVDGTQLYIQFPGPAQPGGYAITNSNITDDSATTAEPPATAVLILADADGTMLNYLGVQGSLVLTETGQTFSGNFQFTASDDPAAQVPGGATDVTTDVIGEFQNAPLR